MKNKIKELINKKNNIISFHYPFCLFEQEGEIEVEKNCFDSIYVDQDNNIKLCDNNFTYQIDNLTSNETKELLNHIINEYLIELQK